MSTPNEDIIIVDEIVQLLKYTKPIKSYINSEIRRMKKVPEEKATRERLIRDLEDKLDEIIQNDEKICDKLREIYKSHNLPLRDNGVERLTSKNHCIDAKKNVIEDLLSSSV